MDNFRALADEMVDSFIAGSPVGATHMGAHTADGELDDLSREKVEGDIERDREFIRRLGALDQPSLELQDRIEVEISKNALELEVLLFERFCPLDNKPSIYPGVAINGLHSLLARNPNPDADVIDAATSRLSQFKRLLEQGKKNLGRPPRIFTQIAIELVKGGQTFLTGSIPKLAKDAGKGAEALLQANADALAALTDFEAFLERDLLPRSDGTFVIGRDLFEAKLKKERFLDLDVDSLLQFGRDAVQSTKKELERAAAEIDSSKAWNEVVDDIKKDFPQADKLKDTYKTYMEQAKQVVVEKMLVDFPKDEELRVVDTPAFIRFLIPYAAYSMPGAFEKEQVGLFYVTPVDSRLPKETQEKILSDHSIPNIKVVALHEAYPGHHLQLLRSNKYPSRLRQFSHNTVFIEGWALYCEEMMREQGFLSDPRSYVLQLKAQLWRACRVVIDASLHTAKMSIDEGVDFLVNEALLERSNAETEVRRYTTSPTQPMSYLMGKAEIKTLKSKVQAKLGNKFNLREFHNELLSYGSLPTKFIAQSVLA